MVSFMVHLLKLDHHGRIVIPAEYRKKLSLNEQTPLQISLVANQLVIRKRLPITKEQIDDWKISIKNSHLKPNTADPSESNEKWYSEEYVRNKLAI